MVVTRRAVVTRGDNGGGTHLTFGVTKLVLKHRKILFLRSIAKGSLEYSENTFKNYFCSLDTTVGKN